MGYLVDIGQTLCFSQTKLLSNYIKEHGIIQFLLLYKKYKDFLQNEVKWGDEIELHLIHIDSDTKLPKLQLNTEYLFKSLASEYFTLQPEYGAWMLETVPLNAYDSNGDPNVLLRNFQARREKINSLCHDGDILFAGTVFPLLGVGDFFIPKTREQSEKCNQVLESKENNNFSFSQIKGNSNFCFKHELLNPHPRYSTLCENIRIRRGEKLDIRVPIFLDENTVIEKTEEEPFPGFIYMDETIFGTGNTSIQVTFGTRNIDEAQYLFDQLSVISSILLPLSAATAVVKGKLADVDVRWNLLGDSVDCRTAEERDANSPNYQPKSRWGSISRYISSRPECKEEYNDIFCPLDAKMMDFTLSKAKEFGIELDDRLIKHLGFLFLQDPLIVYSDKIYVDDSKDTNHFENIQSTNWNNVRFKPPPSFDSNIGWRVELRTMECQLTADENVALAMFSYFISVIILKKNYNFYIPISKVDENIARAHKRDAILKEKFWFRKNIEKGSPDDWIELSMNEILHGKNEIFIGLFPLIYKFCKEEYNIDIPQEWEKYKQNHQVQIHPVVENMRYFDILSKRSTGEKPTIAKWIRSFVLGHPKYQKDSIVSGEIVVDLIAAMTAISDGKKSYKDFLTNLSLSS